MQLRRASLLVAILAAAAACKKNADAPAPTTQGAAPAPTAAPAADDPWGASAGPPKPKVDRLLLWAAEKDGKTSYLFGTMHAGVDPTTQLPDAVWQRLEEKPAFVMEANMADAAAMDVKRKDGRTLRQDLGEPHWQKLVGALGEGPANNLNGLKPMIAATLLSLRGLPHTTPMDGALHARAINRGKRVAYLERLELQAAILERWMDVRTLKQMLDDLELGERRAKDMLAAYLAGDETRILALSDAGLDDFKRHGRSEAEYAQMMEDLLYKRNASWIDPIVELHAAGGAFVAVGAMHLVGPRSVNELLAAQGFAIRRLERIAASSRATPSSTGGGISCPPANEIQSTRAPAAASWSRSSSAIANGSSGS